MITCRYAQAKRGLRMHIVPVISGDSVANTALCGKRVERWRMTCNVPLANCCRNCMRVDQQRGRIRAIEIVQSVLSYLKDTL